MVTIVPGILSSSMNGDAVVMYLRVASELLLPISHIR